MLAGYGAAVYPGAPNCCDPGFTVTKLNVEFFRYTLLEHLNVKLFRFTYMETTVVNRDRGGIDVKLPKESNGIEKEPSACEHDGPVEARYYSV